MLKHPDFTQKLQLNGNYVSLIYNSAKVYGNIELNMARCKQILKVIASFDFATSYRKIKVWSMRSNRIVFL